MNTDDILPVDERGTEPARRVQFVELLVFLFLIVPALAGSRAVGNVQNIGFATLAISVILRDLALLFLILYFVWRNGEGFGRLGWRSDRLWRDILIGVLLFIPFTAGAGLLDAALQSGGFTAPKHPPAELLPPRSPAELFLASVLVVVVAVSEETIFRGYLILRFRAVLGGVAAAVILSSVLFSLGHGYEGSAGVITVGAMGLVFALIYLWRQSLVAPMVMHFLQDFIGIVLVPALGMK